MSKFTVRVQLTGADWSDYDKLHEKMEKAGFARFVIGSDGEAYHLPDAEYDFEASTTATEVRDLVKQIADTVRPGSWVLVTQLGSRAWSTKKLA